MRAGDSGCGPSRGAGSGSEMGVNIALTAGGNRVEKVGNLQLQVTLYTLAGTGDGHQGPARPRPHHQDGHSLVPT